MKKNKKKGIIIVVCIMAILITIIDIDSENLIKTYTGKDGNEYKLKYYENGNIEVKRAYKRWQSKRGTNILFSRWQYQK